MAEIEVFSYFHKNSIIHNLDPRLKFITFIFFSFLSINFNFADLIFVFVCIIFIFFYIKLPLLKVLKSIYFFLFILLLLFIARALTIQGTPVTDIKYLSAFSYEGIINGTLFCWKLLSIVLLSIIFTSTTKSSEIKKTVQWYLSPIPFIPAARIAVMLSLLMRFIPLILSQINEVKQAQYSRCIENRKNPVYRLIKLMIPVFIKIFINADNLILAMEARCYSEDRTEPEFRFKKNDLKAIIVLSFTIMIIIFL